MKVKDKNIDILILFTLGMKKSKYRFEAITTGYWCPGEKYIEKISDAISGKIQDGDIVSISEKALSVSIGLLVDESKVKPGHLAKLITFI